MSFESHARWSTGTSHTRPQSRTRLSDDGDRVAASDTDVDDDPPTTSRSAGADADAADDEPDSPPQPKLAPGSVIPQTRLEIVRWLGEGGMGTVFEVRHLDIDRHFAAKLLHRSESVARARRFRREAKTIGNIGSPWVVDIYDFKELADGRLMYLMELVDGPSLLARQAELGALPLPRLIGLARQICKGLADAHQRGFIHRDIKPENIMLATDARGRTHVKIVDFGLAGLLAEPHESSRAGTPMYMSPEQCKGEPADARADIYALGVTLYELGTGRLPFVGDDATALREAHVRQQPIPPSQVDGAPPLPAGFDALVLRCLAKRPEDRFANAREVEAALIELQLDQRIRTDWDDLPAPEVLEPRRRKLDQGLAQLRRDRARERRIRVTLGLTLAAMLVLASALGWWIGVRNRAELVAQREAELAALQAQVEAAAEQRRWVVPPVSHPDADTAYALLVELEALELDRADLVGQQLRAELATELLAHADTYWDTPGGRGFAREFYAHVLVFDPDQPRALARARSSPTAVASLRQRAALGEFDPGELEALAPLAALAEPDAARRLAALLAIYADADELPATVAASIDQLVGELERELPALARARGAGRRASSTDTSTGAAALPELVSTREPAPPILAPPTDVARRASPGSDAREDGSVSDRARAVELAAAGDEAFRTGERDRAERHYQQAIELDRRCLAALIGLHRLHFDRGDFKAALRYAERAWDLRPQRGDLALDVGDSCMKVLDYACARRHYHRAAELGEGRATQRLALLAARTGDPAPEAPEVTP